MQGGIRLGAGRAGSLSRRTRTLARSRLISWRQPAAVCALAGALLVTPAATEAAYQGDNGRIAYLVAGNVWTTNADGTAATQLTDNGSADSPAWSPDGSEIALHYVPSGDSAGIFVMNADGSGLHRVTTEPSHANGAGDSQPTWSPSGGQIAFIRELDGSGNQSFIYTASSDGSTSSTALPGGQGYHPAWSPDGTKIAFDLGGDIYAKNVSDANAPTNLTNSATFEEAPTWSPDGSKIAYAHSNFSNFTSSIAAMDADGGNQHDLVTVTGPHHPSWSPDGTSVAFEAFDSTNSSQDIQTVSAAGGSATNLTQSTSIAEDEPDWGVKTGTGTSDQTNPVITIGVPTDAQSFTEGKPAAASFKCEDAESGIASCHSNFFGDQVVSSSANVQELTVDLPTNTVGGFDLTITARNNAGGTSTLTRHYTVDPDPALHQTGTFGSDVPNVSTDGSSAPASTGSIASCQLQSFDFGGCVQGIVNAIGSSLNQLWTSITACWTRSSNSTRVVCSGGTALATVSLDGTVKGLGGARVIGVGSGNVIGVGSGNVIGVGSGNVINVGAGHFDEILAPDGSPAAVVAGPNASGVINVGAGHVIGVGSGNVINVGAGHVIAVGGGNVINVGAGHVIGVGSGNIYATDPANVINVGSGNVIGVGSGNVINVGAGHFRASFHERAGASAAGRMLVVKSIVSEVTAPGPGSITETAFAKPGVTGGRGGSRARKRPLRLAFGQVTFSSAGGQALSLRFTAAAQALMRKLAAENLRRARSHRASTALTVTITTQFKPRTGKALNTTRTIKFKPTAGG